MLDTSTDDDLVAYVRFVQNQNPHSLRVFKSKTEQDFIDAVEAALLHAVMGLEEGRQEYSKLGELGLSKLISRDLSSASIPATAEEHTNGHVDLTVKHPRGQPFRYLGEFKIWKSVPYHVEGMAQLLCDYSTGRHQRGCCLELVKLPDAAGKLKAIRDYVDAHLPLEQKAPAVDHPAIKGGFVTTHRHGSGWDVEVLHFACNLHAVPRRQKKPVPGARRLSAR